MRYSVEHKSGTRIRVLREAARELRAKGPDKVAVAAVMKRAGLTHGAFYAHFASRDALIVEAMGVMFDDARFASRDLAGADDPRAMLRGYVDFYLSRAHRDARERGCPIAALSGDLARAAPAARERFGAGVAGLADRLAAALGGIGAADPAGEASALLAQMVGAVLLARAVSGEVAGEASDAILRHTRAAIAARYDLGAQDA